MTDRRSPYLILGIDYGASKSVAAKAFARAVRRLRRQIDAPFELEDLNWALHAVEQRIEDPASSIDDYRMPADPSVYEVPAGVGVLNPPLYSYRRRTPPTDPAVLDDMRAAILLEVAAALAKEYRGAPLPQLHYFAEEGPK